MTCRTAVIEHFVRHFSCVRRLAHCEDQQVQQELATLSDLFNAHVLYLIYPVYVIHTHIY